LICFTKYPVRESRDQIAKPAKVSKQEHIQKGAGKSAENGILISTGKTQIKPENKLWPVITETKTRFSPKRKNVELMTGINCLCTTAVERWNAHVVEKGKNYFYPLTTLTMMVQNIEETMVAEKALAPILLPEF